MGEAKRRGHRAQRIATALARQALTHAGQAPAPDDLVPLGFVVRHRDTIKLLIGRKRHADGHLCLWAANAELAIRFKTHRSAQFVADELGQGESVGRLYEDQQRYYVEAM